MSSSTASDTPANRIATAQATLELALRISAEIRAGRIDSSIYRRVVKVETGGPGVLLPAFPQGTQDGLKSGAENLVLIALSATALVADETLEQVFGKASLDSAPDRIGIRVMVNQFRNAFAHNPWRPKWVVFPKYRKLYQIVLDDGTSFKFDATSLNGDGLKPEHVGGFEFWVRLLQHCERLVH